MGPRRRIDFIGQHPVWDGILLRQWCQWDGVQGQHPWHVFYHLHSFTAWRGPVHTNSDGANPAAELILSGNALYGTSVGGGSSGNGTVLAINTDGTGFTTLYNFTAT